MLAKAVFNAVTFYAEKLTAMFEEVEEQFRKATVENYRNAAKAQYDSWAKRLEGPEPAKDRMYPEYTNPGQYVRIEGGVMPWTWELKQKALVDGRWFVDYKQAEADANRSVDQAKAHFIAKQSKKLANATRRCGDKTPELNGSLHFSGLVVEGRLHVAYNDTNGFSLHMSMIRNCRYQRGYTSFYQFPARFYAVKIGGEEPKARISEAWLALNFHG